MPAPRIVRLLAAMLAADVVGYSSLMERDESGTLARLKAHRKEVLEPLGRQGHALRVDLRPSLDLAGARRSSDTSRSGRRERPRSNR